MTIKAKTRKILWSKSGNRCAFCKRTLVEKPLNLESNFIVGEECHIVSSKANGPRGKFEKLNDYDIYDNLILLCANEHKLIDEFPETFTVEIIRNIKTNHENWIYSVIEKGVEEHIKTINNIELLEEIKRTNDIDNIILGSPHLYFFDLTSITDDKTYTEIYELFDDIRDYADTYPNIEIAFRTSCLLDYLERIKQFNERGIKFFGKSIISNIPKSEYKIIAMITAFEVNTNPNSIQNGKLMVRLPDNFTPTI